MLQHNSDARGAQPVRRRQPSLPSLFTTGGLLIILSGIVLTLALVLVGALALPHLAPLWAMASHLWGFVPHGWGCSGASTAC